jgi:hypothetical protein
LPDVVVKFEETENGQKIEIIETKELQTSQLQVKVNLLKENVLLDTFRQKLVEQVQMLHGGANADIFEIDQIVTFLIEKHIVVSEDGVIK